MGKRAQRRRKGKRKEAAKKLVKDQDIVWRRLSSTEHKHLINFDAGKFYCPYVPITVTGSFVLGDTTV